MLQLPARVLAAVASALLAVSLLLGPQALAQAEHKPVVLQLQWRPQSQFAGYMVAEEKGFYAEAGIPDITLRWWSEGDPPLKLLADGKVDFCTGWLSQAVALRSRGVKIVNIAQILQRSALMLVARRSSGILEPADINGHRVGLWGADFDAQPMAFFKKFGIKPNIVIQSYSIAPFLRGAVEVASAMYYNEYHKLLEAGLREDELRTFFFADYGLNFPEDGIYCTDATREKRPDLCRALVSASIKGWAYAIEHEKETLDIVMRHCDAAKLATNRNHQRWMLRTMAGLIRHRVGEDPSHWGTLPRPEFENVVNILHRQGLIKNKPGYEDFHRPALSGQGAHR